MITPALLEKVELPTEMADDSKVWMYQSSTPIDKNIQIQLEADLASFSSQWIAHGQKLQAFTAVYHHQFVCFIVDQSAQGATGCSIDTSVRFMQQMEQKYDLQFFDRMATAYVDRQGEIQTTLLSKLSALKSAGIIDEETLVFNNTIQTLSELRTKWLIPASQSWHMRFL